MDVPGSSCMQGSTSSLHQNDARCVQCTQPHMWKPGTSTSFKDTDGHRAIQMDQHIPGTVKHCCACLTPALNWVWAGCVLHQFNARCWPHVHSHLYQNGGTWTNNISKGACNGGFPKDVCYLAFSVPGIFNVLAFKRSASTYRCRGLRYFASTT